MLSIVIQLPDRLIELAPGDEVSFGRSQRSADIVLDDPAILKVAPRRLDMPVPFEIARLVLPTASAPVSFSAFAPEHAYGPEAKLSTKAATKLAFSLNESVKYFLVLVALCELRLRGGARWCCRPAVLEPRCRLPQTDV